MSKQRIKEIDQQIVYLEEKLKNVKGTECEIHLRIVGYYRAKEQANLGKQSEFEERKMFNINKYFEKSS